MVIRHIVGMDPDGSANLLAELLAHTTTAPYVYSHRWKQGDLVVWDNRATVRTTFLLRQSRHHRLLYRIAVG